MPSSPEKQVEQISREDFYKLNGLERQRTDAENRCDEAEAALSRRDEQVRAEVERRLAKQREIDPQTPFIRGTRAALLAVLKYLNRLRDSSTSPQQEVEDEQERGDEWRRGFAEALRQVHASGTGELPSAALWAALNDPAAAAEILPAEEQEAYQAAQESVLVARGFLTQPEADPEVPRCGGNREIPAPTEVVAENYPTEPCPGCPDCQPTPELLGEEAKRFIAELWRTSEAWQRERAKTKQAERDDHGSGKLAKADSYEATWNYYEGLAKGYERAARLAEEFLASTQPVSESPGNSGEAIRFIPRGTKRWRIWNFDATRSGVEGPETLPPDGAPQQGLKATEEAPIEVMAVAEHEAIVRRAEEEIGRLLATQPVPGNSGGVEEDQAEALPLGLCAEGSRVGPWEELPEVSRDAWRRKAREQLEAKCSVCGGLLEGAPGPECDSVGCPGRQGD
jgi:hypothetical protein